MKDSIIFKKTSCFRYIIIFLFSIIPIVDSINGFLLESGKFSIGILYKFFIALIIGARIVFDYKLKISKKFMYSYLSILFFVAISILINITNPKHIRSDCLIKFIFNITLILLFTIVIENNKINKNDIYVIFDNNAKIMILCILVPYILGVGYSSYVGEIGYKGFFYSLNEVNFSIIVLFYFSIWKFISKHTFMALIQAILIGYSLLLLNSKSSLLCMLIGITIIIIEYLRRANFKTIVGCICFLVFLGIVSKKYIINIINQFIIRQSALQDMYGGSVFSTIISGRDFLLKNAFNQFKNSKSVILSFLFGNGFHSTALIEMDFVDIFFYIGVFGLAALVIFLYFVLKQIFKNIKTDNYMIRKMLIIIIMAFSFVTGHVLFMSTSGIYFVLAYIFCMYYSEGRIKNHNVKFIEKNLQYKRNGKKSKLLWKF